MQLKYIDDYYEQVKEYYPDLCFEDYKDIVTRGFRTMYLFSNKGADVYLASKKWKFSAYIGKLFKKKDLWERYKSIKYKLKQRLLYVYQTKIWNGKYYFAFTQEEYDKYIPKKSGRIKNKITFDKLKLYKAEKEPFCDSKKLKYLFELTGEPDQGMFCCKRNYTTRNITLIATRDDNNKITYLNG